MNDQKTVFLVDDEPMALRALTRLLKVEGYKTESFSSGREFMDRYNPGMSGCRVLDIMRPEVTGLEVQEWLIHSGIPLPVIFLTGKDESEERTEALKRGAVDFLMKPVTATLLVHCIEKALEPVTK
jgi:two-component system, LuxR family, response regulator TtrR